MDMSLNYLPDVAHILIGFFFLFFGGWNLYHWAPTLDAMKQKRIPFAAWLLGLGIITQSICGLLIFIGLYVKLVALILIPFTIIVVNVFHSFWQFKGELRQLNFAIYITHMTMTLAGLILLLNTVVPNHTILDLLAR
jgi:uncharacterized membrane protein YphA (DoxX/SURF4 family)